MAPSRLWTSAQSRHRLCTKRAKDDERKDLYKRITRVSNRAKRPTWNFRGWGETVQLAGETARVSREASQRLSRGRFISAKLKSCPTCW